MSVYEEKRRACLRREREVKNAGLTSYLMKEREELFGEKENVILFKNYYNVVEYLREAHMNKMPFVPFRNWLVCFEAPILIEAFGESHLRLIEMLKTSLKNLADSYGYTKEDENGFLLYDRKDSGSGRSS